MHDGLAQNFFVLRCSVCIWVWWLLPPFFTLWGTNNILGIPKGKHKKRELQTAKLFGLLWMCGCLCIFSYSPLTTIPLFLLTPSTGFPSAKTPLTIPTLHEKPAGVSLLSLSLFFDSVYTYYTDCAIQPVGGWWLGHVLKGGSLIYILTSRSWVSVKKPICACLHSCFTCACLCLSVLQV